MRFFDGKVSTSAVLTDPPLPAGTYAVGQGKLFPTIDSAFARITAVGILGGVTLELHDTLYTIPRGHMLRLGAVSGAGPSSRLTIRPATGTHATIRGDSTSVLLFENTKYLTLDGRSSPPSPASGITIHGLYNTSVNYSDCIDAVGDADHNEFLNLTVTSDDARNIFPNGSGGICLWPSTSGSPDSNYIENNVISAIFGITISGSSTAHVRQNVIRGNTIGSPSEDILAWGIQSECADNTLIEGNVVQFVHNTYLTSYNWQFSIGINAYANVNSVIRNNVVHAMEGRDSTMLQAISGTGDLTVGDLGSGLQIYNNMVYDLQNASTKGSAWTEGINLWRNSYSLVAYNTVYLSGTVGGPQGVDALGFWWGGGDFLTVRNNLLVNDYHPGAGVFHTAMYATGATFTSDYNDLYVDTSFGNGYTVIAQPSQTEFQYRTLGHWQGAGKDGHSLDVVPVFSAPHVHIDSTLAPSDVLDGRGTPITGILSDIDGQPRHATNPDIGADEFTSVVSDVEGQPPALPAAFSLSQNYPNPFNPNTSITYNVPERSEITLKVYDVLGRVVATLVDEVKPAGSYTVQWDAGRPGDGNTSFAASGVYFCTMRAGSFVETKKLILLR